MDPLSITAGILAIFGAGGKVGNGLRKLVQLRDAPDALLALCNEVTDLQCVVQNVDDLLQQWHDEHALPSSIERWHTRYKSFRAEIEARTGGESCAMFRTYVETREEHFQVELRLQLSQSEAA
jgi:hypothetical protein